MSNRTPEQLADEVFELIAGTQPATYHEILRKLAYKRPWRPKHTGWTNVKDQLLHIVYAGAVFLPLVGWPSVWTAALSGLLLGAIREWEQYTGQDLHISMFWDRAMDATFFALGGALVFFIVGR